MSSLSLTIKLTWSDARPNLLILCTWALWVDLLQKATVDMEQESLGMQLSGTQLGGRITPRRFWRLFTAMDESLYRRTCCGWVIQVTVGHASFCCLSSRPLSSMWHIVDIFIRSSHSEPMNIWTEVRSELRGFRCSFSGSIGGPLGVEVRLLTNRQQSQRLEHHECPLLCRYCCKNVGREHSAVGRALCKRPLDCQSRLRRSQ